MSTKRLGKIGRNEPCPCGSGRKYKRCCARKADQVVSLSEELVTRLVAAGWSEKDVRALWAEGACYDIARDSLVLEGWSGDLL